MNRLKVMITGAALAAASGGAWGIQLKPELDAASGCYIWRALKAEAGPGIFFPAEAPYITGKVPVFSMEDTPLFLLRFDPSIRADENNPDVRKQRGIYNPAKIGEVFGGGLSLSGKNVVVHVVMQPFPEHMEDGLYLRLDLACIPSGNSSEVLKTLSFGITKIMRDGAVDADTKAAIIAQRNNQQITFAPNSLGQQIDVLKLDGVNVSANCKHLSFWSYIASESNIFITYHWLINREDTMRLRVIHRLAFFAKEYQGSAYDSWSSIYASDALWKANYEAVCRSLKKAPIADIASAENKKRAYGILVADPGVAGFAKELNTQGHVGILRFMWRLKDDFSYAAASSRDRGNFFHKHSHAPGFAFLYNN
ncbi:MAG: hypothetical protein LBE97_02845 [Holosporales bacterium]|jgi:hypothetical protein|nr:hypothetical protein [Holosporales bacterium]